MTKLFKMIKFWWFYVVLKKERVETKIQYGKAINKLNRIYYYKDTFKLRYIGTKLISSIRESRVFIKEQEYIANQYNVK